MTGFRDLTTSIALACLILLGSLPARADDLPPYKINLEEASELMQKANPVPPEQAFYDGGIESRWEPFYIFGLYHRDRDGTIGFYAVNPWTGDVWDTRRCGKRFNTPALRKAQAAIRKRFTAEEAKRYRELRNRYPGCDVG